MTRRLIYTSRMRRGALIAVVALTCSACAGPQVETDIAIKEFSADIVYGDQGSPERPTPPPGANLAPAFPGFIAPPAPRIRPPGSPASPPTTIARPQISCPAAGPFEVPAKQASTGIPELPVVGEYPYTQSGQTKIDGEVVEVVPDVGLHTVSNAVPVISGVGRFDVEIAGGEASVITTYEVDQRGAQDGLFISQIRSSDEFGTDSFTPAVPVKLLQLPAAIGTTWSSTGTDPLHGTTITIHGKVTAKQRVDACGTVLDGWRVEVGVNPGTGQPSRITSRTDNFELRATYVVATQFGGLVIADDVSLIGTSGLTPVDKQAKSTIRTIRPNSPGPSAG